MPWLDTKIRADTKEKYVIVDNPRGTGGMMKPSRLKIRNGTWWYWVKRQTNPVDK
jgi:hypothetical protein